MSKIYSEACRVLMWLGESDEYCGDILTVETDKAPAGNLCDLANTYEFISHRLPTREYTQVESD